jgi:hypothetical protein
VRNGLRFVLLNSLMLTSLGPLNFTISSSSSFSSSSSSSSWSSWSSSATYYPSSTTVASSASLTSLSQSLSHLAQSQVVVAVLSLFVIVSLATLLFLWVRRAMFERRQIDEEGISMNDVML